MSSVLTIGITRFGPGGLSRSRLAGRRSECPSYVISAVVPARLLLSALSATFEYLLHYTALRE